MITKKLLMLIVVVSLFIGAFILSMSINVALADGGGGEENHHGDVETCDNPTFTVAVAAENTRYNVTEIRVPKNTCVQLIFENKDNVEHDISADPIEGEFSGFAVHLLTAGVGNTTFQTPNKDVTYPVYCTIPGHREAGMEAKLIVGEGSQEDTAGVPGFEVPAMFAALIAVSLAVVVKSRKRNL